MTNQEKSRVIAGKVGIKEHLIDSNNPKDTSIYNTYYCTCGYETKVTDHIVKHFRESSPDFFTPEGQAVLAKALSEDDMLLLEFDMWFKSLIEKGQVKPIDMFNINNMIAESSYTEFFYEFLESEKEK